MRFGCESGKIRARSDRLTQVPLREDAMARPNTRPVDDPSGRARAVLAWPLLLTLTGCSSAAPTPIAPAPIAPAPVAVAGPTVAEAAAAYLALVRPLNLEIARLGDRIDAASGLREMQAISVAYADVHDAFVIGLRTIAMPLALTDEVDRAAAAVTRVADLNREAGSAVPADFARIGYELRRALDQQRLRLAELRRGLGLSSTLGS